ncbi:MAG: CoA transferase [Bacteroidetes bacterium]|nr:CoA transferase [Bacteroidota bacterium]
MFSDLKVIELAGVLAGPSVGLFFAELGAKVIKIENPKTNGDVTRSWKLKTENNSAQTSAYFWSVNTQKEFLFIDIAEQKGIEQFYSLLKGADILICNFKKGDDIKLKVDYNTLKKINPTLIYASINGFGEDSPRTAYDLILQAESGFMHLNGEANSNPVKMPVALIDLLAGHQLKEAILIALYQRLKVNKGSKISVSLFDSAIASLANQATNWLIAKQLPKAMGSLHPNIAPYGELFYTSDKHLITFAIGNNKQFKSLCSLIGFESLASEQRFANNQQRVVNRNELYSILSNSISEFRFNDLYKKCIALDIPIGKIRNLKEVFELPEAKALLHTTTMSNQKVIVPQSVVFKIS